MMVYFTEIHLFIGLVVLVITLFALRLQRKSFSYLFFFSVFWVYMMAVVSVVAFPFPVGIPNPHFKPSINLTPFNFGYCDPLVKSLCLRNLYENILLAIPFGFGISFIIHIKPKNIFWLALTFGLALELIQFIISIVAQSPFRIVDINDVILNAMGVLVGYGIFRLFGWLYSYITDRFDIQHKYIFAYIHNVVR